jgi:HlyD family secretion protein
MKSSRKYLPVAVITLAICGVLLASLWPSRGIVPVEVARVERRDLTATVRATGIIVPGAYTNVLGQGYGRVTQIWVHEGERVAQGETLLQVDPVQAAATVRADQDAVAGYQASLRAAQAAINGARARVEAGQADLAKARFNWEHGEKLYQAEVISLQNMESYRASYDGAVAALASARAQLAEAVAEQSRVSGTLSAARARLAYDSDVLSKTTYRAPIGGTITNISARVGQDVIPGVPDSSGAYLMTIADMTGAVARVDVDENNILNLRIGQPAKLSIDAFPGVTFAGRISRVGTLGILSDTGQTTAQNSGASASGQATDFRVDISFDDPPPDLMPGMTVSTRIESGNRKNVVAVPFGALVLRPASEAGRTSMPTPSEANAVEIAAPAAPATPSQSSAQNDQNSPGLNGVFVVRSGRAIFEPLKIGVLGENDVEVQKGVSVGEEIVVGGFTALHELHSGMAVKIVPPGK